MKQSRGRAVATEGADTTRVLGCAGQLQTSQAATRMDAASFWTKTGKVGN